jgi:hypothetical protein
MRFPFSGQPPILTTRFGREPAAAGAARALVRDALTARQVGPETIQDMLVVVSELVTNAIRHAPSPYELRLYAATGLLGCEVIDSAATPMAFPSSWTTGEQASCQAWTEYGRGLALVVALTLGRCGCQLTEDRAGKTVWCLLDRT